MWKAVLLALGLVTRKDYESICDAYAQRTMEWLAYSSYVRTLRSDTPHQNIKDDIDDLLNNTAARAAHSLSITDSID